MFIPDLGVKKAPDPGPGSATLHLPIQTQPLDTLPKMCFSASLKNLHCRIPGVYILVENGYLFPPHPSEIYIFPQKNSVIFAQHWRRQIA